MIGKKFVLAGAAIFTIENDERHYTFRVSRKGGGAHCVKCDGTGYWENSLRECYACRGTGETVPIHFVGLLTGPDNEADYMYVGILQAESGKLVLTGKSKYTDDSAPVKCFRYATACLWGDYDLKGGFEIHHEGRCGRCGRLLTVPESIKKGLGPVCANKS